MATANGRRTENNFHKMSCPFLAQSGAAVSQAGWKEGRQAGERTSACGPIWGTVVSAPTFLNSSNAAVAAVLEYYIAAAAAAAAALSCLLWGS